VGVGMDIGVGEGKSVGQNAGVKVKEKDELRV
jgi:hypothetical protein